MPGQDDIPPKIKRTFERLKGEYAFYVVLAKLRGRFYVYRRSSRWDKESKKIKSVSEFLGRILDDGTYVKKSRNLVKRKAVRVQGQIGSARPIQVEPIQEGSIDDVLMKTLSMAGRSNLASLSRKLGIDKDALYRQVTSMESTYKIRYIAEIDASKLGYQIYVAMIKFEEDRPGPEMVKGALESNPRVLLAAFTKGEYDMLIFLCAADNKEVTYFIHETRVNSIFRRFKARWFVAPYFDDYGFVPFRDRFFDLLKEKVWQRKKDSPRPENGQITNREYAVLRALNSNGKKEFKTIDEENRFDIGRSAYTYHKLKETGVLKRVTISMDGLPIKYNAVMMMEIIDAGAFDSSRAKLLEEIISNGSGPVSKYALVGDIEMPHSVLFAFPVYADNQLEAAEEHINSTIGGVHVKTMIITSIVLGSFCYRRFDKEHTNQYRLLVEEYRTYKPSVKTDYNALDGRQE